MVFGFVFPREFSSLFRVSRGQFVLLRLLSCGDLKLLRDVTGKALCSAVVAPWCYGFGTVLDFFRWLAPRWASSGPARVGGRSCENGKRSFEELQRVQESQAMFKRERARAKRVVLNCPSLDIAHRRLVQSERRYGAEPRLHGWFLQGTFMWRKITCFTPVLKLLPGLHIYNITTFVILLIHTILQPFIKV